MALAKKSTEFCKKSNTEHSKISYGKLYAITNSIEYFLNPIEMFSHKSDRIFYRI